MATAFCTAAEVATLYRSLTTDETTRVTALLPLVSDALRVEATRAGKDLDELIEVSDSYESLVKLVTADIVVRVIRQSTDGEPMTQTSESALGYSFSGTYAVPGGGIAASIMRNDLKRLGLLKPKYGVRFLYGEDVYNDSET